jgi:hypothetical protein
MAKRHYGMGHERKGMRKQEADLSRRTEEMQEADMIREDHSKIANLPQEVMIKPYPQSYDYMPEDIDDGIRGVDRQISTDNRKRDEYFKPKKV